MVERLPGNNNSLTYSCPFRVRDRTEIWLKDPQNKSGCKEEMKKKIMHISENRKNNAGDMIILKN